MQEDYPFAFQVTVSGDTARDYTLTDNLTPTLSRVNILVGENNAGKSRFMRQVVLNAPDSLGKPSNMVLGCMRRLGYKAGYHTPFFDMELSKNSQQGINQHIQQVVDAFENPRHRYVNPALSLKYITNARPIFIELFQAHQYIKLGVATL